MTRVFIVIQKVPQQNLKEKLRFQNQVLIPSKFLSKSNGKKEGKIIPFLAKKIYIIGFLYMKKKKKIKNGFTLIELLVALAIFSIIVGITSGVFLSALSAQRKTLASRELLDQTSYALEYMSRALRMAKKELAAPSCLSRNGLNYEITRGGVGLKFLNYQGICQEFFLDINTKCLKESKGGLEEFLTSADLEIESFNIKLSGESEGDTDQPRVTLFLKIKGKGQKPEEKPEIKIQTTISQRNLDLRI